MQLTIENFDSHVLFYANCFAELTKKRIFVPKLCRKDMPM